MKGESFMPVRKVPKNHQNITGQISSVKSAGPAAFESSLERDFLILLDFNYFIEKFEVQPCKIEYFYKDKKRSYTPDVLVQYATSDSKEGKRILYEVKYRDDLRNNWHIWKSKFKAAYAFALSKGWKFKIITEREIRRPYYLDNAKFLKRYNTPIEDCRLSTAHEIMSNLRETDPETLVAALASDFSNRAEVIHLVWQMLARGYLNTDLTQPLNMKSKIWCP